MQRILIPALVVVVLLIGAWSLWRSSQSPGARPVGNAEPAVPTPTTTIAPVTEAVAARGFRLAGTSVGETTSYAAIDGPDGVSHLYRNGEDVPELGRLTEIQTDHVVLSGSHGPITLSLMPAATPTGDRRRRGAAPPRSPTPPPSRQIDDTPPGSGSSDAPGPQAF